MQERFNGSKKIGSYTTIQEIPSVCTINSCTQKELLSMLHFIKFLIRDMELRENVGHLVYKNRRIRN